MVRSIPLVEFRALGFVWHLCSNHEIGLVCFHTRSLLCGLRFAHPRLTQRWPAVPAHNVAGCCASWVCNHLALMARQGLLRTGDERRSGSDHHDAPSPGTVASVTA